MAERTNSETSAAEAGLRELALALLAPRYPELSEGESPQLLVGQLPPSITTDMPLPPGSRVVGSLVATRPTVVLDTGQSAEDVVNFYHEQLTAAGWTAQEDMPPRHGGFLHSAIFNRQFAHFYRGDDGPSLNVVTSDAPSGRTIVHLTLNPEGARVMFGPGPRSRHMGPDMWRILPPIAPPPRSQQSQEGGSGGGDRVSSSARLDTDLDFPAVAAHYIAQLEKGGWQRQQYGEHDPVAWSTWTFADEDNQPWLGLFIVLKRPDVPRRYWLHVQAEWTHKSQDGDGIRALGSTSLGGFSFAPMRPRS
jgi:hypothetical protein